MKISDFKVMTFDVVGTCIDFETGLVKAVRALGGPKAAAASDDTIFEAYKHGRDKFDGRSSEVSGNVYLSLAEQLGFTRDSATADAFQLSVLRWPAFADSPRRWRVCANASAWSP
jgi:putative hydrolase of the HAD superfamily